jgi:hypothetical protein
VKASAVYRSNIVAFEEFNALWLMLRCASIPVTKPANRMFMSVVSPSKPPRYAKLALGFAPALVSPPPGEYIAVDVDGGRVRPSYKVNSSAT